MLHSYYYYQVGSGSFAATVDRPVCRRGGRTISVAELLDERCERPIWDYDRAFVGPDGSFVASYYPSHDPATAPPGLEAPFVQYNVPGMLALGSGWPSRVWGDLIPMTTEVSSVASFRFAGEYSATCGQHSPEYSGSVAAADYDQCMLKVEAGVYAVFDYQPFPIMKLNGRMNVPKKKRSG